MATEKKPKSALRAVASISATPLELSLIHI